MGENASFAYLEINGGQQRCTLEEIGKLYLFGNSLVTYTDRKLFNIKDKDVDEKHCCMEVSLAEDVYIFDLFSSCGTFLNDERLKPLEKSRIKHGDIIKLGPTQSLRFYQEQQEMSHDSSGFGDNNKNTSDIIASSPETTSQKTVRLKRFNNHTSDNFLMPAVPSRPRSSFKSTSAGPNNSFFVPETEKASTSSSALNISNNRRSDSFIIPETQYCKPRTSTGSNLSIAESDDGNKSGPNFSAFGACDDDEIPETQEFVPSSQRPRLLGEKVLSDLKTLEEKSVNLNDSDDEDLMTGTQIRICTQDYNDGFGDEHNDSIMNSQIIPLIKHSPIVLNSSIINKSITPSGEDNLSKDTENIDKEVANVKWTENNTNVKATTNLASNCSTPDLFDYAMIDAAINNASKVNSILQANPAAAEEDEDDFMPTQVFPASKKIKDKENNLKAINCDKEEEPFLTLSNKENMQPDELEPITDLPPTQLFASHDAAPEISLPSMSSRISSTSKSVTVKPNENSTALIAPTASKPKVSINADFDDEDFILTQAFVAPQPKPAPPSNQNTPHNYFNSTILDDNRVVHKNPASFFAEMERTPKKIASVSDAMNFLRMPEKGFSVVQRSSSATSTTSNYTTCSDSDMDLLMCTPQLIREHIQIAKPDDLKQTILAVKNKNLFGDDTDDDNEDDGKPKDDCLVKLVKIPKDSKDFDQLLPHLKSENENENRPTRKSLLTDEQKAAKNATKEYKFNISFGNEQDNKKTSKGTSSTLSRDERHAARDKEKVQKEDNTEKNIRLRTRKTKQNEVEINKTEKKSTKHQKGKETLEAKEVESHTKTERTTRRKDRQASSKAESTQQSKDAKPEDSGRRHNRHTKISQEKDEQNIQEKTSKNDGKKEEQKQASNPRKSRLRSADKLQENDKINNNQEATKYPTVRMTRLKSVIEEKSPSTSSKNSTRDDDLDSVATQPFVRQTRNRSRSRSTQKDFNGSLQSNTSSSGISSRSLNRSRSSIQSSRNSSTSEGAKNIATSENTKKNTPATSLKTERKRKADIAEPKQIEERKRSKRTLSQDSTATTTTHSLKISTRPLISLTMVDPERFKNLQSNSNGLWAVAKDPRCSEVLVTDKSFRTFKFLLALARGIPIVTSRWLEECNKVKSSQHIPPPNNYLFSDALFEKRHKFSLENSLRCVRANKKGLFYGYEFLMTSRIMPSAEEMKAIVEASGGIVHSKNPPPPKDNQKLYLITSVDDRKDWHKFRRLNTNIIIINTEAIMSAVMRQNCTPLSTNILS